MKKNIKSISILLTVVLLFSTASCSKMLDPEDDGRITYEYVFANQFKIREFYSTAFSAVFNPSLMSASFTDEAQDADQKINSSIISWYSGTITAANHGVNAFGGDPWGGFYTYIRRVNVFLAHIGGETARLPQEVKAGYIAEMHAMRAYYYWQLAKRYGGVPIITEAMTTGHDYASDSRATFSQVVEFILAECDEALKGPDSPLGFPWGHTSRLEGRMTRAAVYALMSEVALYAASPLWADGTVSWERATEITGRSLALCLDHGFELFSTLPIDGSSHNAYENYFLVRDYTRTIDKETIFTGGGQLSVWNNSGLPSTAGQITAGQTPTQNLIDAYEMQATGEHPIIGYSDPDKLLPILNATSGYDPKNPYVGRDPRFYATILFNGAVRHPNEPNGKIVETFVGAAEEIRDNDRRYTPTGYYLRKFNHPNSMNGANSDGFLRLFRLATLYLNFAEAANNAYGSEVKINIENRQMSASDAVNAVRKRAGMPDFPAGLTKQEFETKYRNERRIELAFEAQRPFDLRRWKVLEENEKSITGMRITKENDGSYQYKRFAFPKRLSTDDKFLIFPINLTELLKVRENTGGNWQNPGWNY